MSGRNPTYPEGADRHIHLLQVLGRHTRNFIVQVLLQDQALHTGPELSSVTSYEGIQKDDMGGKVLLETSKFY